MSAPRTPLRYPGGKQRIWRFIAQVMKLNSLEGGNYVEPYAGGAGVAFELLLAGKVSRIHLNDLSLGVYSFWRQVLDNPDGLCRRVRTASLNVEEWRRQKKLLGSPCGADPADIGFAMFYLNRCNRSGMLLGGPIGGVEQGGSWKIDARFPRNELIRRIEAIADRKSAIRIRNWDAERFLSQYVPKLPQKTLVYCDPPYYHKSDRLYPNRYTAEDHIRLASFVQGALKHPWVVSYDAAPEILKLYCHRRTSLYPLQYSAARARKGLEVFIFSDGLILPQGSAVS